MNEGLWERILWLRDAYNYEGPDNNVRAHVVNDARVRMNLRWRLCASFGNNLDPHSSFRGWPTVTTFFEFPILTCICMSRVIRLQRTQHLGSISRLISARKLFFQGFLMAAFSSGKDMPSNGLSRPFIDLCTKTLSRAT